MGKINSNKLNKVEDKGEDLKSKSKSKVRIKL